MCRFLLFRILEHMPHRNPNVSQMKKKQHDRFTLYIKAHRPTYATIYYGGGDIKTIVLMKNNRSDSLGWSWFG